MFGFGSPKAGSPPVYRVTAVRKSSKKDSPSSSPKEETVSSPDFLEPAIDGPPSPERIRAYTEQMKRSSNFGNNSRTNTFSSASSSFRSRDSASPSTDNISLSRKSSGRSNSSSMPSLHSERPESVQIFGSIFSRNGKRSKKEANIRNLSRSTSSLPLTYPTSADVSAKDHYNAGGNDSRRRRFISGPYNFQHVTHTQQEHLPNLARSSRMELLSEFSAIRASQAPLNGELKGIRTQDLHFENFSSEALNSPPIEGPNLPNPKSPRQRAVLRKTVSPPQARRSISHSISHDNLRTAPPRPPRSPLSPPCPIVPPARTSSRTASVVLDNFDPLATTTIERPYNNGEFRKPAPFNLTLPPQPVPTWGGQQECLSAELVSHAVTTPGEEAWPLNASPTVNFGGELADVQEEEEEVVSRRSRISVGSSELRVSQSVPALRRISQEQSLDRPENRMSTTLGETLSDRLAAPRKSPLSPGFQLVTDSWESDIDWCYEHEVEADCDYQWDRCSTEISTTETASPVQAQEPALELRLQNDERVYRGRFRPSLLVPSNSFDVPELSPMSNTSMASSNPRTPSNFLRPSHIRSHSHASSFKESHGFHLSPTLLIPADFQSQMEHDPLYDDHYLNQSTSGTIFPPESYNQSASPIDEGESSTASFRSSNFSRGSAYSSSTHLSTVNSRGSQDSTVLMARTAGLTQDYRNMGSSSSLPDLIPSALRSETELSANVAALSISGANVESTPASVLSSVQHRRNKSLALEHGLRKGANHFQPINAEPEVSEVVELNKNLSPVPESFPDFIDNGMVPGRVHGRKASAPLLNQPAREFKGRARAATSAGHTIGVKKRGSYMLFPQV